MTRPLMSPRRIARPCPLRLAQLLGEARARGLTNVNIVTSDINTFDGAGGGFDRVVSIEMMDHVKNYELLLERVASWLKDGGRFFVHIFTHVHTPFHYTGASGAE